MRLLKPIGCNSDDLGDLVYILFYCFLINFNDFVRVGFDLEYFSVVQCQKQQITST